MSHGTITCSIPGQISKEGCQFPIRVVGAKAYSLMVAFDDTSAVPVRSHFEDVSFCWKEQNYALGPCSFEPHKVCPRRRRDDPPPNPGHGQLVFLNRVYDFSSLLRSGRIVDLEQKVRQLPLLWRRRASIKSRFQQYTVDLLYDLQVYRSLFDDIDRQTRSEHERVVERVRTLTIEAEYGRFSQFLDRKLDELESEIREFSKFEHELHGFFFRKQLWDIIMCSAIMRRTNLKPRGYAGDSAMMRMLYDRKMLGRTIFSRFMHWHPVQHPAAQAVRNRRAIVSRLIRDVEAQYGGGKSSEPVRVLSVACGPMAELGDVLSAPSDADRYEFTLLDQDEKALAEASREIDRVKRRIGKDIHVDVVRGSVRTLQQVVQEKAPRRYHFLYSLGLFDYLTPPVGRMVLGQLYDMVLPGGRLLIGNYHHRNPSRRYMEYWLDWVLYYRNEEEFLDLASGLKFADIELFFEEAGAQMFMMMTKRA